MSNWCYFLILFLFSSETMAQEKCNCCSPKQTAFDFWVGEWRVVDSTDQLMGENSITKLENGCILNERWKGKSGYSGSSYNYYNQQDSTWNQLWVDFNGNHLELKGQASPGKMVLRSKLKTGKNGNYYDQISWTKISDDKVIQLWERYDAGNNKTATVFKGFYLRK